MRASLKRDAWLTWLSRSYWKIRFRNPERAAATDSMRVSPRDPEYQGAALREEIFWEHPPLTSAHLEAGQTGAARSFANLSQTGDPTKSWMDDLIARGPFDQAAVLGSTQGDRERQWLLANGSRALDVFDIGGKVLSRAKRQLGTRRQVERSRFRLFRADLNFVRLTADFYDVIWTYGCLHHVTNLEYLMDEVEAALRPGGLFAIQDYVGEARAQYSPDRLARANELLQRVPARFRRSDEIRRPTAEEQSPFEAIRSDEVLDIARSRFEVVHLAEFDALHPLFFAIDAAALEREDPALLERLFDEEARARREPHFRKCSAYAVFRKRGPVRPSADS